MNNNKLNQSSRQEVGDPMGKIKKEGIQSEKN
jgi:hypothetical protein